LKPPPLDYYAPASLEEAVALKAELGEDGSVLAGGQSLVPLLNMRLARPRALIDLNRVRELAYIRANGGGLAVGAMTRQRTVERSEEVEQTCPLLREALLNVAHPIIRNRGTLGGSIAHADCAAELPAALVALGGTVTARGPRKTRTIGAEEFFSFHFTNSLDPDEILTEVWFPDLRSGTGFAFLEVARRHGDFALAAVAAVVSGETTRLAFAGVGPKPILVESDDPDAAAALVTPVDDVHASAEYRRKLVRVLADRALGLARRRAAERQ
jgi:aerobic carbon-monoxide dehydrogenase medium subunit